MRKIFNILFSLFIGTGKITRKPIHFFYGDYAFYVTRNLHAFTRKTRNLPSNITKKKKKKKRKKIIVFSVL